MTIFTSCNGQEKTNTLKGHNTSQPSPTVIRNFKAVGLAPDFGTTLVSQYIRSIFQDSKWNLWFGTIAEGVVRYDTRPQDGQGKTLTYFSNPDGFVTNSVFAIMKINLVIFGLGLIKVFINMMPVCRTDREKDLEIIIKKMA